MGKHREENLKLSVTVNLKMRNSDRAYTDMTTNKEISIKDAKKALSLEAYVRNDFGIVDIDYPIVPQLFDIAGGPDNIPELLEIFYGIYSCQTLSEEILFDADTIISAIESAAENSHGVERLINYPEIIKEYLPIPNESVTNDCPSNFTECIDAVRELMAKVDQISIICD